MPEYIERETVKQTLATSGLIPKYCADNKPVTDKIIDAIPAADVVEVVRCKDCRFLYFKDMSAYCPHSASACWHDGFCNYGERRCDT